MPMVWGVMLLLVLLDEYRTLLVVCVCWTAGYPWISMDIEYVDIHGYPWISMDAVLCDHVEYPWISMYFSVLTPHFRF